MLSKGPAKIKKTTKPFPYKVLEVDKENIPSSSHQVITTNKKKQEEEQMLEYMKVMYKSHGENLFNKLRSELSIRTALGKIDDNDKLRALELQQVRSNTTKKAVISGTTFQNATLPRDDVKVHMKTFEVVEPQLSQPSQ